jgi:asparagine synthase (glutamine-hydrolysing)
MCGIAGIVDLAGAREFPHARVARMTERLVHRGPDAGTVAARPGLVFGHRRLAIIDLADGAQPMATADDRLLVVYNGEIYNHAALRAELEAAGAIFRTRSDTEVVLEAYRAWGEAAVERFDGMFAFALWDAAAETLVLARDRLGEKPLYYTRTPDGRLVFASEIEALLAGLDATPELEPRALVDVLAFGYVPDPRAVYAGVEKLAPAHRLVARRGAPLPAPERWWKPRFTGDLDAAPGELEAVLTDRLRASVEARLMSDVPLGAFLSGGVDSSGIVALMAAADPSRPPATCSIGFTDPAFDEREQAALVAARYGTTHRSETVEVEACGLIDRLAEVYGEPFADASALPSYLLSGFTRRHVTVALSGDGGDELFAGYRRYPFHLAEERLKRRLPTAVRRHLVGPLAAAYPKLDWAPRALRAKATLEALAADTAHGYLRAVTPLPARDVGRLLDPRFVARLDGYDPAQVIARHLEDADTDDPLARAQYVDLMTWLPGRMLTKVDRASMAHGLEVRPPLLDHHLVEWACRLPAARKLDGFAGKTILKNALRPLVPAALLDRPKRGFGIPLASWLRRGLEPRLEALAASRRLEASGLVRAGAVDAVVAEHRRGGRDHGQLLWTLLMLDAFLARAGVEAARPARAA